MQIGVFKAGTSFLLPTRNSIKAGNEKWWAELDIINNITGASYFIPRPADNIHCLVVKMATQWVWTLIHWISVQTHWVWWYRKSHLPKVLQILQVHRVQNAPNQGVWGAKQITTHYTQKHIKTSNRVHKTKRHPILSAISQLLLKLTSQCMLTTWSSIIGPHHLTNRDLCLLVPLS